MIHTCWKKYYKCLNQFDLFLQYKLNGTYLYLFLNKSNYYHFRSKNDKEGFLTDANFALVKGWLAGLQTITLVENTDLLWNEILKSYLNDKLFWWTRAFSLYKSIQYKHQVYA
jgi:hypothetical protein